METKQPMPLTVQRVQWIDFPPNPRRRMDVLGYADAELIPYQIIRVPVPQVTEFGRAACPETMQVRCSYCQTVTAHERRNERILRCTVCGGERWAPIGPENPPVWRMLAIIAACWLVTGFALVGAFTVIRGALHLLGVIG